MKPTKQFRKVKLLFGGVIFVVASFLLFFRLSTIPGLHGDEAWAGLRANSILNGEWPVLGMNNYTGSIHQYLIAPFLFLFGYKVEALRVVTVLATLFTIFLYYGVVKRLMGKVMALLATLILISLPFFALYGRIANEVFALNPILALLAVLLILKSHGNSTTRQWLFSLLAGICLGLGIWNHAIFSTVPLALLVVAFYRRRLKVLRSLTLYIIIYGILLALIPRIFWQVQNGDSSHASLAFLTSWEFYSAFWHRLTQWPIVLLQVIHGDILFKRFSGEIIFITPNLSWLILIMGAIIFIRRAWKHRCHQSEIELIIFGVVLFLSTALICPANADRYFLLVLYLVPLAMAYVAVNLFKSHFKLLLVGILCLFVPIQLARIYVNFFQTQSNSHGRCATLHLGTETETSNHFIRTDELYAELSRNGVKEVYGEFFIAMPLRFYNLNNKSPIQIRTIGNLRDLPSLETNAEHSACVIVYAGGLRRVTEGDCSEFHIWHKDAHFLILAPVKSSN